MRPNARAHLIPVACRDGEDARADLDLLAELVAAELAGREARLELVPRHEHRDRRVRDLFRHLELTLRLDAQLRTGRSASTQNILNNLENHVANC